MQWLEAVVTKKTGLPIFTNGNPDSKKNETKIIPIVVLRR